MNLTDNKAIKQIIEGEEFQTIKDRLVKHYNINASAKYTLEPRDDFIYHIIKEFIEIAIRD